MINKYSALFVIFSICWCYSAGNNYDHYGYDSSTSSERINAAVRCVNVHQANVDLKQMKGLWFGSEVVIHSQYNPGVYEYDSCVMIHLTDVTEQVLNSNSYNNNNNYGYNNNYNNRHQNPNPNQNEINYGRASTTPQYLDRDDYVQQQQLQQQRTKYLRLVWSERDNNLEYTFNYTTDSPGIWSNIGDQRGSLVTLNKYTQFSGTVQVVKAVNDHLVLTFCGNDVKSSIYTAVLSRNRLGLSSDELRSIHSLLNRRGLLVENIRQVCNAAATLGGGMLPLSLSLSLLFLLLLWCRRQ
ncbi:metabotropic glutamate receptor-like protein P [Drosophila innubila]|uniref:metabotropic glutamate receptor-like protein P n=1 Tax=Drosophila innubila TaxID=198719 RepID=UPI00148C440B|nr:metabotropic glutamate receptor-like protein P [Drosophila innubila]